jgi:hypothetical protein
MFVKKDSVPSGRPALDTAKRKRRPCVPEVARLEDRALLSGAHHAPVAVNVTNPTVHIAPPVSHALSVNAQVVRATSPSLLATAHQKAEVHAESYVRYPGGAVKVNRHGVKVHFPGGSVKVNRHSTSVTFPGGFVVVGYGGTFVHWPGGSIWI